MAGMQMVLLGGVPPPPQVSASDVYGAAIRPPNTQLVSSNNTTTVVTGGAGPFTYLWTYVSGSALPEPTSAISPNPFWQATISGLTTAVWRVTVTDVLGRTGTADINITLELIT